jgi:CHASE2 domain-containing sensor protein
MKVAKIRVTAFFSIFPGIEVHANIIDNILRKNFLWAPTGLLNPAALVVILMALIMGFLQPRVRAWYGLALLINLIFIYAYLNYYFLQTFHAGLEAFRQGNWESATKYFAASQQINPSDSVVLRLVKKIQEMAQQPLPPDWDGTSTLTEK